MQQWLAILFSWFGLTNLIVTEIQETQDSEFDFLGEGCRGGGPPNALCVWTDMLSNSTLPPKILNLISFLRAQYPYRFDQAILYDSRLFNLKFSMLLLMEKLTSDT